MPKRLLLSSLGGFSRAGFVAIWGACAFAGLDAASQVFVPGEVAQFTTAEGFLVTRSIDLTVGLAAGVPAEVHFQMAFGTQESASPGGLHDSVTATLATTDDSLFAAVATMDVFGLTLAPVLTGGVPVNAASIDLAPLSPPMSVPAGFSTRIGYSISLPVPDAFAGKDLRIYFDLVKGDVGGTASEARAFVPLVAVPEPEAWWLLAMLPAWAVWRRSGRSGRSGHGGEG